MSSFTAKVHSQHASTHFMFLSYIACYFHDFTYINIFTFNKKISYMTKSTYTKYPSYEVIWELGTRTCNGGTTLVSD